MSLTVGKLAKLAVWAGKQAGKRYPTHGNYDITSKCNFRCEHCYFFRSYVDDDGRKDLADAEWLAKFREDYRAGVKYAYITGGEPALRPRVISFADQVFDTVVIFSNGTIPIDPAIRRSIFVSLDGPREVHAAIRGADLWEQIMKNTRGDERVLFTCTLSTTNDKYIEEVYKIAKKQKCCGIMYGFYTSHRQDFEKDPLYLSGERRERALSKLGELARRDPDYVFVTKKMLAVYRDHSHASACTFNAARGSLAAYYPDGRKKKLCTVGEEANCASCGCPQPVAAYAGRKLDWRAIKLAEKFLRVQFESEKNREAGQRFAD